MIRPLRRRHFWMIAAVAITVVALYFAALSARPEPVLQEALPEFGNGAAEAGDR